MDPSPVKPALPAARCDKATQADGSGAMPRIVVSDDQCQIATSLKDVHYTQPYTSPSSRLLVPQSVLSDDQHSGTISSKGVYGTPNASASTISLIPTRPPGPSPLLDAVSSHSQVYESTGESVGKVLTSIRPIADLLDRLAKVHPIVEVTWLIASSAYKALLAQHERDKEIVVLYDRMIQVYECATREDTLNRKREFSDLFDAMIKQSIDCCVFIANYSSGGYLRRLLGNVNASQKIQMFLDAFQKLESSFDSEQLRSNTVMAQVISDILVELRPQIEFINRSEKLRVLQTNEPLKARVPCLAGTRQKTLSEVVDWIIRGKESILWISGVAGCGKSSVMATLNDYLINLSPSRLATFIRFDRFELNSPSVFVRTLAEQLSRFDSRIGASIARVVDTRPQISNHTQLAEQFRALIRGPLDVEGAIRDEGPIVILVDALDECMQEPDGSIDFRQLLALLSDSTTFQDFPFLRFIVASRPEGSIRRAFRGRDHIRHFPLDITSPETLADIEYCLSSMFDNLYKTSPEFRNICTPEHVSALSRRASGLFIWAVTAFRFLERHPTKQRLDEILAITPPEDAITALTDLYKAVLSFISKEGREIKELICAVFGFILAFKTVKSNLDGELPTDPGLTPPVLCELLRHSGYDVGQDILLFLSKLASILPGELDHDRPLVFLHKSFDDFILDPVRSREYQIKLSDWHGRLSSACVSIVHSNISRANPEYGSLFRFASYYWFFASVKIHGDVNNIPHFMDILRKHLLRWIYVVRSGRREEGLERTGIAVDIDLRNMLM
ncbi:hypothetical protein V5O48_013083, partial [Marasmius crinis-equi]